MDQFPPLDAHAHVDPSIPELELLALRAVVLIATRSQSEYAIASGRLDPLAVWGVGIHPGLHSSLKNFDDQTLRRQLQLTPLLSEIGLDRRSPVNLKDQRRLFRAVLDIHDDASSIASVHSSGRTAEVVDLLQGHRCSTVILHWWRGSPDETRAAIALGCYFSFNSRDAVRGSVLDLIPLHRVLTETDHPYGDSGQIGARPGGTEPVEQRINPTHPQVARQQVWSNFRKIVDNADALDRLPGKVAGLVQLAPPN